MDNNLPPHLPLPTGPYVPGCVDVMTGYGRSSLFLRIYYPTSHDKSKDHSAKWPSWIPQAMYITGFAYVLGLWTFVLQLLAKFMSGDLKIPVVKEGSPLTGGKLPVAVFSHGMGGTRFLYSTFLSEVASWGYVIAAVEHRDESAAVTWYCKDQKRPDKIWLKYRHIKMGDGTHQGVRAEQVERRAGECAKALQFLRDLNAGVPVQNLSGSSFDLNQFKDQLDFSSPVQMGHSFGGATSLLTLAKYKDFKYGVILDPWMFPVKDFDISSKIDQPFIVVNTETFHIPVNLSELERYVTSPQPASRYTFTIRRTTHENQSDSVFVIGYWLDLFKRKIDPKLATNLNNALVLQFLGQHVRFLPGQCSFSEFLQKEKDHLVEDIRVRGVDNKAKKIPHLW